MVVAGSPFSVSPLMIRSLLALVAVTLVLGAVGCGEDSSKKDVNSGKDLPVSTPSTSK